jgi:hypothetical protein
MKPILVIIAVTALSIVTLSFATPVSPRYSAIFVVTGTIDHFDEAKSTLILRPDRSDRTVGYTIELLGTQIKRDDKDIILEALRPGQRVTVYFRVKRGGYKIATTVSLVSVK